MSIRNYDFSIQTAYARAHELFARATTLEQISAVYKLVTDLCQTAAGEEPELLDLLDRVWRKQQDFHRREANRQGRGPRPRSFSDRGGRIRAGRGKRDPKRKARARQFARSSLFPKSIRDQFTDGELAALFIIAEDWRKNGVCECSAKEIGDRAGVCTTIVRNAYRRAQELGLILIEQPDMQRTLRLPNRYHIVSVEWKKWLKSSVSKGFSGVKKTPALESIHNIQFNFLGKITGFNVAKPQRRRTG
ncbi:hypothetical protein ELZ18_16125 [Brucella abortus]|uniref:hypothetical protein n=1 Tax=Brucella abortus TaxID=235 RepID=UPI000F8D0801|nr:hypothetical protein [Brucella abortus]RUQ67082.1 hypothetical protein ELZ23_16050 [Brucella abortus]RUQ88185.1 hypothetical protein ELZ18_16125 [Brucella abortus]RUQ89696.1 hypothetical protein ELZ20_16610 [Brucella abortus]RUQ96420.1 hypothetical protein ELZ21_15950 [Brucella abortus]